MACFCKRVVKGKRLSQSQARTADTWGSDVFSSSRNRVSDGTVGAEQWDKAADHLDRHLVVWRHSKGHVDAVDLHSGDTLHVLDFNHSVLQLFNAVVGRCCCFPKTVFWFQRNHQHIWLNESNLTQVSHLGSLLLCVVAAESPGCMINIFPADP